MNTTVQKLIQDVSMARIHYLNHIVNITEGQAIWRSDPDEWNINEVTEHLFWAEQGGIFGMWKSLHAIRSGDMVRRCDSPHKDLPIEQVIDITW